MMTKQDIQRYIQEAQNNLSYWRSQLEEVERKEQKEINSCQHPNELITYHGGYERCNKCGKTWGGL